VSSKKQRRRQLFSNAALFREHFAPSSSEVLFKLESIGESKAAHLELRYLEQ
jgi:hypothetical protein